MVWNSQGITCLQTITTLYLYIWVIRSINIIIVLLCWRWLFTVSYAAVVPMPKTERMNNFNVESTQLVGCLVASLPAHLRSYVQFVASAGVRWNVSWSAHPPLQHTQDACNENNKPHQHFREIMQWNGASIVAFKQRRFVIFRFPGIDAKSKVVVYLFTLILSKAAAPTTTTTPTIMTATSDSSKQENRKPNQPTENH